MSRSGPKVERRIYLAIVEGRVETKQQRVVHGLVHGSHRAEIVSPEDPEAKKAELFFPLKRGERDLLSL